VPENWITLIPVHVPTVEKFYCKSAQLTATLCECRITEIPSVRNTVRHCENECKESLSNHESTALR